MQVQQPISSVLRASGGTAKRLHAARVDQPDAKPSSGDFESRLLECLSLALAQPDFQSAADLLANRLRTLLECRSLALAVFDSGSAHCRVVARTDGTPVDARSALAACIEQAMREAVVLDCPVTHPKSSLDAAVTTNLARRLASEVGSEEIVVLPLKDAARNTVGACLITSGNGFVASPVTWQLVSGMATPVAACLTALRSAYEPPVSRLLRCGTAWLRKRRSIAFVASALVLLGILALPWPYRLRCDCVCEPALRRFVAAPFDGTLLETHISAGDMVSKGQVLAVIDGGEIRSQLASARSKYSQTQQRYDAALASGNASEALAQQMELKHLAKQIDILSNRETQLLVRSPLDGVIVSGDLQRIQGAPLRMGETLFEISPLSGFIAEVAVDQSEISYVAAHLPVAVAFDAAPGRRFYGTIDRIHPRAELQHDRSVFIAEVALEGNPEVLAPGIDGTARIMCGRRSVAWILFHRSWNAVRATVGW